MYTVIVMHKHYSRTFFNQAFYLWYIRTFTLIKHFSHCVFLKKFFWEDFSFYFIDCFKCFFINWYFFIKCLNLSYNKSKNRLYNGRKSFLLPLNIQISPSYIWFLCYLQSHQCYSFFLFFSQMKLDHINYPLFELHCKNIYQFFITRI